MEITRQGEENGVITQVIRFDRGVIEDALDNYLAHHHASGLKVDISTLRIEGEDWFINASGTPGEPHGYNPGDSRLRAEPSPTAAGEFPTTSDVQRMVNGLPPRLKP
jgi:hypothetical protein